MVTEIKKQKIGHNLFYLFFGTVSFILIIYYFSNTLIHYTSSQQFPINSFERFPLTFIIFPAELFSFLFSIYFVYNLVQGNSSEKKVDRLIDRDSKDKKVAILIPVFNEPKDIVLRTLIACEKLKWDAGTTIYLLDDSKNEQDINNMNELAKEFNLILVRRPSREGYKAGSINYAINNVVTENFFMILDSDQAPIPEFLEETMDYFSDSKVGFVQSPQNFINNETPLERAQQLGTNIFYQAQCVSKAKDDAMPFCGTNLVIKTEIFKLVNGFSYYTATEDIEIGLRINEAGYYGAFVPKILVNGYATTNFSAYASQQYRWANGNLAILRKNWVNILFGKFSLRQQIHFFFTLGWWVIGLVSLIYIFVPILSLFFGGTHHTWLPTGLLMLLFLNVAMGLGMIYASLNNRLYNDKITIKDAFLQYSLITNSLFIYTRAAINALFGRYIGFVRTDKGMKKTGFWEIKWNLLLAFICFTFSIFSVYKALISGSIIGIRTYFPVSLWLIFYTIVLASSIIFVGEVSTSKVNSDELIRPSFLKKLVSQKKIIHKYFLHFLKKIQKNMLGKPYEKQ